MEKMKVTLVSTYPPKKCGLADYAGRLAVELKNQGIEVNMLNITNPSTRNPFYPLRLGRSARKYGALIHAQFHFSLYGVFGAYVLLFLAAIRNKVPVITTIHEVYSNKQLGAAGLARESRLVFMLFKFLNLMIGKYSQKVIVHTQAEKKRLSLQSIPTKKIEVIPQGIIKKSNRVETNYAKTKLGLPKKKLILTIFGFVKRSKGHDLILQIMNQLPNCALLVAGGVVPQDNGKLLPQNEDYYKELQEYVQKNNLEQRVVFQGYVSEEMLPTVLSATDLFIFPYRQSISSAALPQVIQYKKPIIASDLEGFKELEENSHAIELFRADSPSDLLTCIKTVIGNKGLQKKLVKNAQSYCEKFNWEETAKMHAKLYREILRRRGSN